jgi:hypothetical protein
LGGHSLIVDIRTSRPVEYAVAASLFVLELALVVLFSELSRVGRWALVASVVVAAIELATIVRAAFVRPRLSGSTIILGIGLISLLAGTNTDFGDLMSTTDVGELLFFGVLPICAGVAFVWAAVQFFRFRALQFVLEVALSLVLAHMFLTVSSQL